MIVEGGSDSIDPSSLAIFIVVVNRIVRWFR